jgi:hypothetical protein
VKSTAVELLAIENPKIIDYLVKDELKKKDVTTLAFRKYCDYQKYQLFRALKNELTTNIKLTED